MSKNSKIRNLADSAENHREETVTKKRKLNIREDPKKGFC